MDKTKIEYLIRSAFRFFTPVICPNCNKTKCVKIDQKYFFTKLYECQNCFLQFRHPIDSNSFSFNFYQSDYVQDDGITTDLPSKEVLDQMIKNNFSNSPKNADSVLQLWKCLYERLEHLKAIDYGCSWGYMSYQFLKKGIDVQGFEISKPRAKFGNDFLGLKIKSDIREIRPDNDLFYSSHVIEHVPSIGNMIKEAKALLKEEGVFIAECPNGSSEFRIKNPKAFHQSWGLVHPNYLSVKFYQFIFQENPYLITTSPYDFKLISEWDGKSQITYETSGDQLLVISKPNVNLK